jgi:hypothetical protein
VLTYRILKFHLLNLFNRLYFKNFQ